MLAITEFGRTSAPLKALLNSQTCLIGSIMWCFAEIGNIACTKKSLVLLEETIN